MIQVSAPSFYTLKANGEAAELIASIFSPGVTGDIIDVTMYSEDFGNDIEPIHELDASIETIKSGLVSTDLSETVRFNPLYFPNQAEELNEALEVEPTSGAVGFTAMDGNPFVVRKTEISTETEPTLIQASVAYHQYDMPSYEIIVDTTKVQLN